MAMENGKTTMQKDERPFAENLAERYVEDSDDAHVDAYDWDRYYGRLCENVDNLIDYKMIYRNYHEDYGNYEYGDYEGYEYECERLFDDRYAEIKERVSQWFKEADQLKKAFYQIKPEFLQCPVTGFSSKDGKCHPFQKENAAILMQAAVTHGYMDSRWISVEQILDNSLFIKKGEKPVSLVGRNRYNELVRIVSYFNVEQLALDSQRKIPQIADAYHFRDTVVKKMAEYLKEHISFEKGDDLSEQFATAWQHGYHATKEIARHLSDDRIAAIDKANLREPAANAEMKLMQEAKRIRIANPEKKNFMYLAAVVVLKDGKFDQKAVAEALNKVSPNAAGLDFDRNYGQRVVNFAMKNISELKHERMRSTGR